MPLRSAARNFLGAHGNCFDLETKYTRLKENASAVFLDPEGYKKYVAATAAVKMKRDGFDKVVRTSFWIICSPKESANP
jgi:hypothetical protein